MIIRTSGAKRLLTAVFASLLLISSGQGVMAQYVCQVAGMPTTVMGTIDGTDALQTGRINRNGIPSSCTGKTNSLFASTMLRSDAHNFTNTTGQDACVTVDFDATACAGNTTQAVAYSSYNPALPGDNVIGDFGFSTTGTARFSFPVAAGANFTVVIHEIAAGTGCPSYSFTVTYRTNCRQPGFDIENDGLADLTVYRPSTTNWEVLGSMDGPISRQFGLSTDLPFSGNFRGDGKSDFAVGRDEGGTLAWYYANEIASPSTNFTRVPWGLSSDKPVPGDYDGDGRTDVAIYRPATSAMWYVLRSSDSTLQTFQWGSTNDIPVPADYDGDLKTDFVLARPDLAGVTPRYQWFLAQSNFNFGFLLTTTWGTSGDIPVSADFDGNGKADIAVFRPSDGSWWVIPSNSQSAINTTRTGLNWGINGDSPQPADYDGDGIMDFAVFRGSEGNWYIRKSSDGSAIVANWGMPGDRPRTSPLNLD